MLRPEEIASPAPTRAFTFELSPPKSPPRDVEYHYAGKSANSRDRTFTGKTKAALWAASEAAKYSEDPCRQVLLLPLLPIRDPGVQILGCAVTLLLRVHRCQLHPHRVEQGE